MSALSRWSLGLCERLHGALLGLYPAPFLRAWGPELRRTFRDCCQAAWRERGWLGLAGAVGPLYFDLLRSSLAERFWPTCKEAPLPEPAAVLAAAAAPRPAHRSRLVEATNMMRMNLLPFEPRLVLARAYKHLAFGSVLSLLALSCIGFVYSQTGSQQAQLLTEAQRKELVALELDRIVREVDRFKRVRADLVEKLDTIQRLRDEQKGPLRLLTELRDKFPRQVWLQSLRYSRGRVHMNGHGLTLSSVGELLEGLKRSRHFSEIDLERSVARLASGQQVYTFTIAMRFDADPERTAAEKERKARAAAQAKARKQRAKQLRR